jgi:hypothetical protein
MALILKEYFCGGGGFGIPISKFWLPAPGFSTAHLRHDDTAWRPFCRPESRRLRAFRSGAPLTCCPLIFVPRARRHWVRVWIPEGACRLRCSLRIALAQIAARSHLTGCKKKINGGRGPLRLHSSQCKKKAPVKPAQTIMHGNAASNLIHRNCSRAIAFTQVWMGSRET